MNDLINYILPFLIAVESGGDPNAIGDGGKAVGILQIHKCVVDDVNRIYGKAYAYADRLDVEKSNTIARLYLRYWGWYYEKHTDEKATAETLARIHNGGPRGWKKKATEKYWAKVQKAIKNGQAKKQTESFASTDGGTSAAGLPE